MKLTTFSVAKTKENKAKLITSNILTNNYQNKCKIVSALFLILLTYAIIYKDFCMKTRLSNIFEITKIIILFIESPYKVLIHSSKRTALT